MNPQDGQVRVGIGQLLGPVHRQGSRQEYGRSPQCTCGQANWRVFSGS
jgi:hypothetical protein